MVCIDATRSSKRNAYDNQDRTEHAPEAVTGDEGDGRAKQAPLPRELSSGHRDLVERSTHVASQPD